MASWALAPRRAVMPAVSPQTALGKALLVHIYTESWPAQTCGATEKKRAPPGSGSKRGKQPKQLPNAAPSQPQPSKGFGAARPTAQPRVRPGGRQAHVLRETSPPPAPAPLARTAGAGRLELPSWMQASAGLPPEQRLQQALKGPAVDILYFFTLGDVLPPNIAASCVSLLAHDVQPSTPQLSQHPAFAALLLGIAKHWPAFEQTYQADALLLLERAQPPPAAASELYAALSVMPQHIAQLPSRQQELGQLLQLICSLTDTRQRQACQQWLWQTLALQLAEAQPEQTCEILQLCS